MTKSFSVLIVDDHSVVRQGIALSLKKHFSGVEIFHAADFESVVSCLGKHDTIDLILLDINIPGGNFTGMVSTIKSHNEAIKILVFSAYEEQHYALRYIQAGANGYLNKNGEEEEIIYAVNQVLSTGKYISEELKGKIEEMEVEKKKLNPLDELSKREFQIAKMLVDGYGNLEIANQLNLHMSTVSTYKIRIFNKLELDSVVTLAELYRIYTD